MEENSKISEEEISAVPAGPEATAEADAQADIDAQADENGLTDSAAQADELYRDEKQKDIKAFQGNMDRLKEEYTGENRTLDIVKAVLGFFAAVILAFGWMLLMLMLVSFVTLSYVHFEIGKMILFSVLFAIVIGVVYVISKVKKGHSRRKR